MSMSFENILLTVIVILGVIALLLFLVSRNKKDKKEFESGGIEDTVEETKADQHRNTDKI
ncbi:MAG: hypothetical protein JWQ30_2754 [Sediminibacterium sp.]|nr:hypothetical protein [Sediminibacterium sp.]